MECEGVAVGDLDAVGFDVQFADDLCQGEERRKHTGIVNADRHPY